MLRGAAVAHVNSVAAGYAPAAEQQVAYADYPVVAAIHPVVAAWDAPADGTQHVLFVRVGLMAHNAAVCLSAIVFFCMIIPRAGLTVVIFRRVMIRTRVMIWIIMP